jgi:NAD-dependent oxidoreductase involved in siderophore biosynthesis
VTPSTILIVWGLQCAGLARLRTLRKADGIRLSQWVGHLPSLIRLGILSVELALHTGSGVTLSAILIVGGIAVCWSGEAKDVEKGG